MVRRPSREALGGEVARRLLVGDHAMRALTEHVLDEAVVLLDTDGCVVVWSAAAERLYGHSESEIVDHHASRFCLADDVGAGRPGEDFDQAATNGPVRDEAWRVRRDGSRFWARVT